MIYLSGHRHLPLGVLHVHLRRADRVLRGGLPGEEEDNLAAEPAGRRPEVQARDGEIYN